jgi:hypothetical protein
LTLVLDDTAACASAIESIDIPAVTADTWTRVSLTLEYPELDSAIASVGINMVTDKGAFALYLDDINAVDANSRNWAEIPRDFWSIVRGSNPKFRLTSEGLSLVGTANWIRLSGFACPDLFSDDSTDSEVDPAFLIAQSTGMLLLNHTVISGNDIHNAEDRAKDWLSEASRKMPIPKFPDGVRWVE